MKIPMVCVGLSMMFACSVGLAEPSPRVLMSPQVMPADADMHVQGAAIERRDTGLRVQTRTDEAWPGVTMRAPEAIGGTWDVDAYEQIEATVRNVDDKDVRVMMRVDNPGGDGHANSLTREATIPAGGTGTIIVPLVRDLRPKVSEQFFDMHRYPVGGPRGSGLDATSITQVIVFVPRPDRTHDFVIERIVATGTFDREATLAAVPDAPAFFPFVDRYGQYKHRTWPGKVTDDADFATQLEAEHRQLARETGPTNWTQYGGWADGPQLEATGHFYPAKHDGRWWLVDPEGRLFWSHGITCVRAEALTTIEQRDGWFEDLPEKDALPLGRFYGRPWGVTQGRFRGQLPVGYDFVKANLYRKYGDDWQAKFVDTAHRRLRSWGINTVANWSAWQVYDSGRTPYTRPIFYDAPKIGGRIADPFDPKFAVALREGFTRHTGQSRNDPWCIGYFIDNEMSLGNDQTLARLTLGEAATSAAKRAFVDDLRKRYETIAKLNEAWATDHADWDALLAHRQPPEAPEAPEGEGAHADLKAFNERILDGYFKTCAAVIKEMAPNKLYLGCRFAGFTPRMAEIAARHTPVMSFNLYRGEVLTFDAAGADFDRPIIIGEFHFVPRHGRGLFGGGIVEVADEAAQADSYKTYIRGALQNPRIVGAHWFQYYDQPATGRPSDGENAGCGFVSVTDTPHTTLVKAARHMGERLYQYRTGDRRR